MDFFTKKTKNKIIRLFILFGLIFSMCSFPARADEIQTKVMIYYKYADTPLSDVNFSIYRQDENGGVQNLVLIAEAKTNSEGVCAISLKADDTATYRIKGETKTIDGYTYKAEEFTSAFTVSLINAYPKCARTTVTVTGGGGDSGGGGGSSGDDHDSTVSRIIYYNPNQNTVITDTKPSPDPQVLDLPDKLTQTGLLWWPIAVLLFGAAGSISIAFVLIDQSISRNSRNWRKAAYVMCIIGGICIIAAAGIFAVNKVEEYKAGIISEEVLKKISMNTEKDTADTGISMSAAEKDRNASFGEALSDKRAEGLEAEAVAADYIGILSIDKLGLNLPIGAELSYPNLRKFVCRFSGETENDDLVIAGHNYKTHFGRLNKLTEGDRVEIQTEDGETLEYSLAKIEILDPDQVRYVAVSPYPLSLFTCTPGGLKRLVLRFEKV